MLAFLTARLLHLNPTSKSLNVTIALKGDEKLHFKIMAPVTRTYSNRS